MRFINGGGKGAVKKESRDVLSTNGWIFLCQSEIGERKEKKEEKMLP